jgi:hypothetical protein
MANPQSLTEGSLIVFFVMEAGITCRAGKFTGGGGLSTGGGLSCAGSL